MATAPQVAVNSGIPWVFFGANSVTCVIAGRPSRVAENPSRLTE